MRPASAALLFSLAVAAAAQAQPPGVDVSPTGGRFKVRFPGRPEEKSQKTRTPLGELTVYTATFAAPDGGVYLVSHVDYPPNATRPEDAATLLSGARDGLVGKDGKLVSETPLALGPDRVPGREVVIDKGRVQLRYRLFLKDTRLFQTGAVGGGEFVTGNDATDFLNSFELVK